MVYYVTFKVDARYTVGVEASSAGEAKQLATNEWYECDIGELSCVDARPVIIEDESGNYVWED